MSKLEEAQVQAYDIDLQLVNQPIFAVRKITKCTLRITNILKNIRNAKVILRDIEMDGVKIIGFDNSVRKNNFFIQSISLCFSLMSNTSQFLYFR